MLVVDDDELIIDGLSMILKSAGYQVYTAENGNEALKGITQGIRPDAIICDFRLLGDSGIDVLARIREATADNLPALLFTGDTSNGEIERQIPLNCTVLQKAVETQTLLSWLRKAVNKTN